MTGSDKPNKDMASELLAADNLGSEESTGSDRLLAHLIATERAFEERVRRLSKVAWAATFATLPLAAILPMLIVNSSNELADVLRPILVFMAALGVLSFFVALLATISWLFRSNAPKLMAIERRLAALEEMLAKRPPAA